MNYKYKHKRIYIGGFLSADSRTEIKVNFYSLGRHLLEKSKNKYSWLVSRDLTKRYKQR
jgi:hypothetical protein